MRTLKPKRDYDSNQSFPMINIIWVGKRCTRKALKEANRSRGVIDHDILGIIEGMDKLKNPITFWCLLDELKYYQDRFKENHSRVIVKAIEPYIKESSESKNLFTKTHAENFLKIKSELLSEKRICTRNILNIKLLFSILLLANEGNFVCDSYFKIIKDTAYLPAFSHFYAPWQPASGSSKNFECWMMYSPASDCSVAKKILVDFEANFIGPNKLKENDIDGHDLIPRAIGLAIANHFSEQKVIREEEEQWEFSVCNPQLIPFRKEITPEDEVAYALLLLLGIKKIYLNTHKDNDLYFNLIVRYHLGKDNVSFFERRWHNKEDLEVIWKMIEEKYDHGNAKYCQLFVWKELKMQAEIVNLFKNYDTFGWRNHRDRVKEVIRVLEKNKDEIEFKWIINTQLSLYDDKSTPKEPKRPSPFEASLLSTRWSNKENIKNKKKGRYYETLKKAELLLNKSNFSLL